MIFVFAFVTTGISIYSKIQASGKARLTESDINDNNSNVKLEEKTLFQRAFQCFDIMDNYNRLFQISKSPNNFLSCIAGIRLVMPQTSRGTNEFLFLTN